MGLNQSAAIACLALGMFVGPLARAEQRADDTLWKSWEITTGFRTSYHENYFLRGGDASKPNETFFTVYTRGEMEFEVGPGDLTVFAGGGAAFAAKLSEADHQTALAGLSYEIGDIRVRNRYTRMQNRVFGEENDRSFFDVNAFTFDLRYEFTDWLRAQGDVRLADLDFSSPGEDRDATKVDFKGTLRWAALDWLAFRGSFLWTNKNADGDRYSYDGPGFGIAAEIRPVEPLNVFVRYRRRWREYDGAAPTDSNFDRDDTIDSVDLNARWMLTDYFGLELAGMYRHGDSTRSDRNYNAGSVTGGFFVTIGSRD